MNLYSQCKGQYEITKFKMLCEHELLYKEHSDSVVECYTGGQGLWVRDSLEAVCCVLEQDILSSA